MILPKISLITPSFNQGAFIEKTIKSVLNQKYPNLEYIIIDGGSSDNSIELIKKYDKDIAYWVSEKDKGQSDALIKGIKLATGDIIGWLNSDDWLADNALLLVGQLFNTDTNVQVINGDCILTDSVCKQIQFLSAGTVTKERLLQFWIPGSIPPQPSIFFKKSLYNSCEGLNPRLMYAMDYDLWLQFIEKTPFLYIPSTLSYYRVHEKSKTGSDGGFEKFIPEWEYIFKKRLEREAFFSRYKFQLRKLLFKNIKSKSKFKNLFFRLLYKFVS